MSMHYISTVLLYSINSFKAASQ